MNQMRTIDLTYGAVFVVLMAIGANITVWFPMLTIPIGGADVPLSLQTFFAVLAGLMLGRKLGSFSMLAYMLVGIAGVPVFAGLSAGPRMFISPTGGFIISFIFVALVTGWIVNHPKQNYSFVRYCSAALLGTAINYIIGVTYMYAASNMWLDFPLSYTLAWSGMIPFLIKDIAFAGLAALFMVRVIKRIPVLSRANLGG
ncbi:MULTISPECIES: biotin transporter BioY [Virgibacillus]|uniref:biotin transporter BioY n=1 Tax=Virgibacillus TaxID=84406 RepID=UPI000989B991|nr:MULTISPECIES: biotin transporter BioY [Virgibacillus]NWO14233.1 biotin transporter BioY [Virgibacillus sp.]